MMRVLTSACAVLGFAWVAAGCNAGSSDGEEATSQTGTVEFRLEATSSAGNQYRLRDATFDIWGYPQDCYNEWREDCEPTSETLSSEDYLDEDAIEVDLLEGYYDVNLERGWRLEKVNEDGSAEAVEAVLLNTSYQSAWVSRHSTTWVTYQFGIGDETLWLTGQLELGVEVYEDPDSYYNPVWGTCSEGGMRVEAGGYVSSGDWGGYAWVSTEDPSLGSTISPEDFSAVEPGQALCVSGTVAADAEYGGVAILGLNLSQPIEGGDGNVGVWYPWGSGIAYDIANAGGSTLRIQIQGEEGYPSQAWCADVTEGSGMVYWWDFNTHCWDSSGDWYDGVTPLQTAMILVPGDATSETPFDFCANCLGVAY